MIADCIHDSQGGLISGDRGEGILHRLHLLRCRRCCVEIRFAVEREFGDPFNCEVGGGPEDCAEKSGEELFALAFHKLSVLDVDDQGPLVSGAWLLEFDDSDGGVGETASDDVGRSILICPGNAVLHGGDPPLLWFGSCGRPRGSASRGFESPRG